MSLTKVLIEQWLHDFLFQQSGYCSSADAEILRDALCHVKSGLVIKIVPMSRADTSFH